MRFKLGMVGVLCVSIILTSAAWVVSDDCRPVFLAFIGGVVFHGSVAMLLCVSKKKVRTLYGEREGDHNP